jgi:predicted DNA-binding ribbon-helix-helix protein
MAGYPRERRPPRSAHQKEKRSLRIENSLGKDVDTTISMELFYWAGVDAIARRHGVRWRWLVRTVLRRKPRDYKSRSGWLRYYVTGYWILGPRRDLPLFYAFMPAEGWSLRQLKDHFAAG